MSRTKNYTLPDGRLWPNTPSGATLDIEVFGATGEYKSGKTLLGLSIAPGVHPEDHAFAGKPRTLLLDFEKSAGTYGGTGCKRVDVPSKMLELKSGNYKPVDVFTWFMDLIENKIKPGQFDVIMADPITDLESGLVDFVKANPGEFGLTSNQVTKGGGLLWGAVKDHWKRILLKLGAKCQTFYFTSHLRQVWQGNTPTSKREPKGKETLMELASLYLWLERKPDKEGKLPAVPSGIVLKERLADTIINEDGLLEIIQLMPPRLLQATVAAIRGYIANPPDYSRLKIGERVIEEEMTSEEKLRLELAKAEAEQATEESRLARLQRQAELQAMQRQTELEKPQASDQTAQRQADKEAQTKAAAEQAEIEKAKAEAEAGLKQAETESKRLAEKANGDVAGERGKCTKEQVARARELYEQLGMTQEQLEKMLARANAKKVSELSEGHCSKLIAALEKKLSNGEPAKN